MAKCLNCRLEVPQVDGKRHKLYCNGACKKAFQRKSKLVDNGTESISGHTETVITGQSGTCWCCGKDIASILVCCQECAWSGEAAAKRAGAYPPLLTGRTPDQMETDLHTLRPTGNYQMTVMERLFYRPSGQLLEGQTNFVSLPGRACYGVH